MKNIFISQKFPIEKETNVQFNKNFTKREKLVFDFLIKDKESILSNNITIHISKLKKIALTEDTEEVLRIFQKLAEKVLVYNVYRLEFLERCGVFSILTSFYLEGHYLKISFTEEFSSIFQENSYFKKNNFDTLIFFQTYQATSLYNFLKFNISINKSMEISITKIKNILGLGDSYSRFFDFEKIILKPVIKEITQVTKKDITYSKIKNKNSSNSKIIGLLIEIKNTDEKDRILYINETIKKIEHLIKSEEKEIIWTAIYKTISEKGYDYIDKNTSYSLLHFPKNEFYSFYMEALNYNYSKNRFKNKVNKFSEAYKFIEKIEKKYDSLAQLHSDLFKILANLKFNYLTLNPNFLKSLQSLSRKKELEYFDNHFIIFCEYNEEDMSYIYVFEN